MKKIVLGVIVAVMALQTGCAGDRGKEKRYAIAFVPKIKGIPYFTACQKGAEEAGKELGLKVVYDGPTKADRNLQLDLLNNWIASGEYDCLAVACTDKEGVAPALRQAREQKMPVVTYDADAPADARDFFVNMATYDGVARAMVDALLEELGANPKGKIGIVTSSLEAPNQAEWAKRIKVLLKKYPDLEVLPEVVHGEDRDLGVRNAGALVRANRDQGLVGIIGLTSIAVPAAAEAVRQAGLSGKIAVTGVSTPRDMRDYVKDGTVKSFILWSPVDLGYLTVHVCDLVRQGKMPETGTIEAGRLKKIQVKDREVLLGEPLKFTKENLDKYDF
ncbi:MAG: substrate-binding domain-containing protein [Gemmataceae bacterium]